MARARHKIDRAKARRAPLPTALITCEGRVTEPVYLDALPRHLGLPMANVQLARVLAAAALQPHHAASA